MQLEIPDFGCTTKFPLSNNFTNQPGFHQGIVKTTFNDN
jgi:hypothetical protein